MNLRVGGVLCVKTMLDHECESEYGSGKVINPVYDLSNEKRIVQDPKNPHGYLTTLISDLESRLANASRRWATRSTYLTSEWCIWQNI